MPGQEFGMTKKLFHVMLLFFMILPILPLGLAATSDGYLHNSDYYAVSFDGEGDAIVRAKLVIENTMDEPIDSLSLEVPGRIVVYKIVQEYPIFEKVEYEKTTTSNSTLLELQLPESIYPNSTGTVVLMYKISRYAKSDLIGIYSFDFKTIIDRNAVLVENVRVAVNVQEDLYLKGATASVDYQPDFFSEVAMQKVASEDIVSPYYGRASGNIEYATGIVKNASNLDPWESFHVNGQYSANWLALYFIDILIVLIVLGVLSIVVRVLVLKNISLVSIRKLSIKNSFARVVGFGFISAAALVGSWVGIILSLVFLSGIIRSGIMGLIAMLVLLSGFILSIAIGFGFPIYSASKHSPWEGFLTGVSELVWLIVLLIGLSFLMSFLSSPLLILD